MSSNDGLQPQAQAESPQALARQVSVLIERDRLDMARDMVAQGLRHHPNHPDLLYQAARVEVLDERHSDALEHLTTLLSFEPRHEGGRYLLFYIEKESGHLPEAEELVLGLLRDFPQDPDYYASYARLMLLAMNFGKAGQLADEALRLGPNNTNALSVKVLCDVIKGRKGHDSRALVQMLVRQPDDAHTLRMVILALVHDNRPREALRLAQELLRAYPRDRHMLDLVIALKQDTHWSLIPLWPVRRWGWGGSAALWVGMLLVSQMLGRLAPDYRGAFSIAWLTLVVYSWVWPPLLKRWFDRGARR